MYTLYANGAGFEDDSPATAEAAFIMYSLSPVLSQRRVHGSVSEVVSTMLEIALSHRELGGTQRFALTVLRHVVQLIFHKVDAGCEFGVVLLLSCRFFFYCSLSLFYVVVQTAVMRALSHMMKIIECAMVPFSSSNNKPATINTKDQSFIAGQRILSNSKTHSIITESSKGQTNKRLLLFRAVKQLEFFFVWVHAQTAQTTVVFGDDVLHELQLRAVLILADNISTAITIDIKTQPSADTLPTATSHVLPLVDGSYAMLPVRAEVSSVNSEISSCGVDKRVTILRSNETKDSNKADADECT